MGKPQAPTPPNPQTTAQAQTASNLATATADAELGRVNQSTPYGNSNYQITGYNADGTPQYAQSTTLSPQEQNLFNAQTSNQANQANIALAQQPQLAAQYSRPIDTSSLPGLTSTINPQDVNQQVQSAENAAYNQQAQYLNPQFAQQQAQLRSQDANEGIVQGSNAYNTDQQNLGRTEDLAYGQAQNQAIQAGQQEQNTLFGQSAQQADLQNSANQLGMQNLFSLYQEPENIYSSLANSSQVQNPTFQNVNSPQVSPTNVAGIDQTAYGQQLQAYQQQLANNPLNSLFSLGGSLGSAALLGGL